MERDPTTAGLRRLPRDDERLEVLSMYSLLGRDAGGAFGDRVRIDVTAARFADLAHVVANSSTTLAGWRAQYLFEATVVALGRVRMLKTEDAGDSFFKGQDIRPPDFRVVDVSGRQFLVEVKSVADAPSDNLRLKMRGKDLRAYRRYCDLVGVADLRVATFWESVQMWTLSKPDDFTENSSGNLSLRFRDAVKTSDMLSLGDRLIGSEAPLSFTLRTDPNDPPPIDDDGTCVVTFADAFFSVAGQRVIATNEQQIVHLLMRYGGWPDEQEPQIEHGRLLSITFTANPPGPSGQGFSLHRSLSSMYALKVYEETMVDGSLTNIRPTFEPNSFPDMIPDDYDGDVLKLWRLLQRPASTSADEAPLEANATTVEPR
jgi:hypothetical protein